MRKQLSQGLLLPATSFPNIPTVELGMDFTEQLGILKWEPPEEKGRNFSGVVEGRKGSFPTFIPKTDQERIQNFGAVVMDTLDDVYEVTMKKDGSSITVFKVDPSSKFYKGAKELVDGVNGKQQTFWQKLFKATKKLFVRTPDEPAEGICSRNVLLPMSGSSDFHVAGSAILRLLDGLDGSYAIQA